MDSVLIVSSQPKSIHLFEELLAPRTFHNIHSAADAGEAGRLLVEREFDLCLINAPLRDDFGAALAEQAATGVMQVMLVVKSEIAEQVAAKMESHGVFVIAKPLNRQLFWNALQLMAAAHSRLTGMQRKNQKLLQKIEDIRMIDRAKYILIERLKMSEEQAHRHIEKQAMDTRVTRREVAERILSTYSN